MRSPTIGSGRRAPLVLALLLALTVPSAGCKKASDEPEGPKGPIGTVKVTEITVGRILGADGKLTDESKTNSYWINDTFYVQVDTEGDGDNITVEARWRGPDGTVAAKDSKTLNLHGKTVIALQAAPPPTNWAVGDYKVEILMNGNSMGSKDLLART